MYNLRVQELLGKAMRTPLLQLVEGVPPGVKVLGVLPYELRKLYSFVVVLIDEFSRTEKRLDEAVNSPNHSLLEKQVESLNWDLQILTQILDYELLAKYGRGKDEVGFSGDWQVWEESGMSVRLIIYTGDCTKN